MILSLLSHIRRRRCLLLELIVIVASLATLCTPANADDALLQSLLPPARSNTPQYLPAEQAFQIAWQQNGQQVRITLHPAPGYYLYRDKISVTASQAQIKPYALPAGKTHHDDFLGNTTIYDTETSWLVTLNQIQPNAQLTLHYQGCTPGLCYPPKTQTLSLQPLTSVAPQKSPDMVIPAVQHQATTETVTPETSTVLLQQGTWWHLLSFWLLGLGLSLTPCMYPMYPVLSAMLTHQQSQTSWQRGLTIAVAYVFGMAVVYTLLGIGIGLLGLGLQSYLQSPWVLGLFSVFYLLLAILLLRNQAIQLPTSLQNRLNQYADHLALQKLGHIALLGGISGLIGSPCTSAPLSGILLYIAQQGSLLYGGSALFLLSLGMGTPLLILGVLGGHWLPKAGVWMVVVKHVFALLLLSMPILLLSRFMSELWIYWLWRGFATFAGLWLIMHFWPDAGRTPASLTAILLVCGLAWFAPHPQKKMESPEFITIHSTDELNRYLAEATSRQQPVMLDFYASWCTACQELEEKTFADPRVRQQLHRFTRLQIDLSIMTAAEEALMTKYQVLGLPNILFFGKQGQQLRQPQISGFVPPHQLTLELQQCQKDQIC